MAMVGRIACMLAVAGMLAAPATAPAEDLTLTLTERENLELSVALAIAFQLPGNPGPVSASCPTPAACRVRYRYKHPMVVTKCVDYVVLRTDAEGVLEAVQTGRRCRASARGTRGRPGRWT